MNSTIVNLRGTSGAGKSTVVFHLLDKYTSQEIFLGPNKKKPTAYQVTISKNGPPLFIIGSYNTQCGGCDGIPSAEDVMARVDIWAERGHVLFEGLLISSYWGQIGRWSTSYADRFVFAYLNTPLDICLERVKRRRVAAGNTKPLNPDNTTRRVAAILATRQRALEEKRRVVDIDYQKDPALTVLSLFQKVRT